MEYGERLIASVFVGSIFGIVFMLIVASLGYWADSGIGQKELGAVTCQDLKSIAESLVLFNFQSDKESVLESIELPEEVEKQLLEYSEEFEDSQMYLVGDNALNIKINQIEEFYGINSSVFLIRSVEASVIKRNILTMVTFEEVDGEVTAVYVKDYLNSSIE